MLLIIVLSFLLFSLLFGIVLLVPFYGSGILNTLAEPDYKDVTVIAALKAIQIVNQVGGLLLPALIYLWLCMPADEKYSGYNKSVSAISLFLSVILIIVAQPLVGLSNEWNSNLTLPEWLSFVEKWMKASEQQGDMITEAFLSTTSATGLLVNIFMIAILPAFAEEILFRRALAGLFKDWTKNIHLAVFLSSFIFAAIHMQFYGFLPRFLLGITLGYLFFWSGNIWLPIAAHFTNNFLSVLIEFLFRKGFIHTNAENFGTENAVWLIVISMIGVTGVLYSIHYLSLNKSHN